MKPPFYGISEKNKKKLFTLFSTHIYTFKENEDILPIIRDDNAICIIGSGHALINRINYDGSRTLIDELVKDSIFGTKISSLNSNEFKIITKEPTTIIVIDYDNLINENNLKYDYYNTFLLNIFCIINEITKKKNDRIRILTKKSIRNKLLEYLKVEQSNQKTRKITIPFSYTELADYLAIDRCAMTRELKYMKEEKFIEVKGKKITILF